jgi:hypothetical protein
MLQKENSVLGAPEQNRRSGTSRQPLPNPPERSSMPAMPECGLDTTVQGHADEQMTEGREVSEASDSDMPDNTMAGQDGNLSELDEEVNGDVTGEQNEILNEENESNMDEEEENPYEYFREEFEHVSADKS